MKKKKFYIPPAATVMRVECVMMNGSDGNANITGPSDIPGDTDPNPNPNPGGGGNPDFGWD